MEAGIFAFRTMNLGDDMQSYAALAHMDRVDALLDRDHLADFAGGSDTTAVFNSWFQLGEDFRRPADRLRPIWHGFASGRPQLLEEPWRTYLGEQGSIGCRDRYTTDLLNEAGLDAFWSGCLTLFIGRALPRRPRERRGVVFVDVPASAEALIPPEIARQALRVRTFVAPSILDRPLERWAWAARLVDLLAGAELVVTRRLHVALPAASLGTPVVAIPDPAIAKARRRFSGYETILPVVFLDEFDKGSRAIDWAAVEPARIPPELLGAYDRFLAELRTRRLTGGAHGAASGLDDLQRNVHRLINPPGIARPGRLRLRLQGWTSELDPARWSDRYVDVALSGFPGLSKFRFEVEFNPAGDETWVSWGLLRDLIVDEGNLDGADHELCGVGLSHGSLPGSR